MGALPRLADAVAARRRERLEALRKGGREILVRLPVTHSRTEQIQGRPILFTMHIEARDDGRILVLVRSDRPQLMGLVSSGATEGFWLLPDDKVNAASEADVIAFFAARAARSDAAWQKPR